MKKVFIVSILILCLSCEQVSKNWEHFFELKNDLNVEFVNHFPKEFKYKDAFSISIPPSKGKYAIGTELVLLLKNIDNIESKNLDFEKLILPNDSCNLIVNRFYFDSPSSLIAEEMSRLAKYCQESLPIPNFAMVNSFLKEKPELVTLPNDFEIYIIDAKKGKFLEENEHTVGTGLPEEWKNGYSKGIAYSEKRHICIYWLIIW